MPPFTSYFGYSHLTGGWSGGQADYVRVPYGKPRTCARALFDLLFNQGAHPPLQPSSTCSSCPPRRSYRTWTCCCSPTCCPRPGTPARWGRFPRATPWRSGAQGGWVKHEIHTSVYVGVSHHVRLCHHHHCQAGGHFGGAVRAAPQGVQGHPHRSGTDSNSIPHIPWLCSLIQDTIA